MLHRSLPVKPGLPFRRVRLLIEDESLAQASLAGCETAGMEIAVCSGPSSMHDICPLVVEGSCPALDADVVVSNLDGPWAVSIERAWRQGPKTVVATGSERDPDATPKARFAACVGAALCALIGRGDDETATPTLPPASRDSSDNSRV